MTRTTEYAPCVVKVGNTEMVVKHYASETNEGIYLRIADTERKNVYCLQHTKGLDRKSADNWARKIRIHANRLADLWNKQDTASLMVHLKLIS